MRYFYETWYMSLVLRYLKFHKNSFFKLFQFQNGGHLKTLKSNIMKTVKYITLLQDTNVLAYFITNLKIPQIQKLEDK